MRIMAARTVHLHIQIVLIVNAGHRMQGSACKCNDMRARLLLLVASYAQSVDVRRKEVRVVAYVGIVTALATTSGSHFVLVFFCEVFLSMTSEADFRLISERFLII